MNVSDTKTSQGRGLYTMTVASQLTGLSQRTLRLYEEEGLIKPYRRSEAGQRLFSDQDIDSSVEIYSGIFDTSIVLYLESF